MKFDEFKVVEVSTGHMSPTDNEILQAQRDSQLFPLIVLDSGYGYLIYLRWDEEKGKSLEQYGLSEEFITLYKKACQETDARFMNLDCDAPLYDELPQFDW